MPAQRHDNTGSTSSVDRTPTSGHASCAQARSDVGVRTTERSSHSVRNPMQSEKSIVRPQGLLRRGDVSARDVVNVVWRLAWIDFQLRRLAVIAQRDRQHLAAVPVRVGSRIRSAPNASVAGDRIVLRVRRASAIDRREELDVEAVVSRSNLANAVRSLSVPLELHDAAGVLSSGPTAVADAADVDFSFRTDAATQRAFKVLVRLWVLRHRERIH